MKSTGNAVTSATDWVVHKFGGTSVYDADCFRKVADIVESQVASGAGRRLAVVLSAAKGTTDVLLGLVTLAEKQDPSIGTQLQAVRDRHRAIAEGLLTPAAAAQWLEGFDRDRADLEGVLHTTSLMRSAAQNVRDLVAGYGELWSTSLFTACSGVSLTSLSISSGVAPKPARSIRWAARS